MTEPFAWYVGIDWGYEEHQVCVMDAARQIIHQRRVPHELTALTETFDWIARLTAARRRVAKPEWRRRPGRRAPAPGAPRRP